MKKGFTLIELLIVVAIIGLLASIVLVGLGGFRARGRDARRIADLRETQNALELYYTKNNAYPNVNTWSELTNKLITEGIGVTTVSNDPLAGQTYAYGIPGSPYQNYVLQATLEDSNNPALKDDVDGTVYGVNCGTQGAETDYCVQF
jgi:prepilin-type N-terminal cleavage/methylation domain-containing protein